MTVQSLRAEYERDGFVFPLDAMSEAEALQLRSELEEIEQTHGEDPNFVYAINGGTNFVLPMVDALTRRPEILDAVEALLGPDLIAFGAALWAKPASSSQYVSWHQDLTYWGMDGAEEVTAWIALSPATVGERLHAYGARAAITERWWSTATRSTATTC